MTKRVSSIELERLKKLAQEIDRNPAGPGDHLSFLPQLLVLTGLPHRDPGDLVAWERRNGTVSFFMQQGAEKNRETGQWARIGFPFGVYPRLFNEYITSHAVKTGSPFVPIGRSFREFEQLLGIEHGGKNSRGLHLQARRFIRATLGWSGRLGDVQLEQEIKPVEASAINVFWNPENPDQTTLWPSYIKLNAAYFDCIMRFRVPMDRRAYRELGRTGSSLAMDVLAWLSLRTHGLRERTPLLSWATLANQFGSQYGQTKHFAAAFRAALKLAAPFHKPRVEVLREGIRLHPPGGWSLVPKRPRKELPAEAPSEKDWVESAPPKTEG